MNPILRIIPPKPTRDGYTIVAGTKVETFDGHPVAGISRIELLGEVDNIWRAKIECLIHPDDFAALLEQITFELSPNRKRMTKDEIAWLISIMLKSKQWSDFLRCSDRHIAITDDLRAYAKSEPTGREDNANQHA